MAKTRESEGPKGPRTSKAQSALASATICFSRFSQKSRFSWHNLSTFTTAKMHENFNRVSYLRYKHRVKKLKQFVDQNKSYARLKFCKIVVFVSKRGRYIWAYLTNSFCVTDGICTDFSKFNQVNSIFSGCHLAQGYFWTQSMLSVAHFVLTILRDLSRRI